MRNVTLADILRIQIIPRILLSLTNRLPSALRKSGQGKAAQHAINFYTQPQDILVNGGRPPPTTLLAKRTFTKPLTMSDGPDKTDELYPIAVLIDELKVRGIPSKSLDKLSQAHLLTVI